MLIERTSEVAFEEFVFANSFSKEPTDKLEVTQVVRVDLRRLVNGVQISRTSLKESVIRIEDFARQDQEPLSKEAACILSLFSYKYNSTVYYCMYICINLCST